MTFKDEDSFRDFIAWYDYGKGFTVDGKEQCDFLLDYVFRLRKEIDRLQADINRLAKGKWAPAKEQLELAIPPKPSKYPNLKVGNSYRLKDLPLSSKIKYCETGDLFTIKSCGQVEVRYDNGAWDYPEHYVTLAELPE